MQDIDTKPLEKMNPSPISGKRVILGIIAGIAIFTLISIFLKEAGVFVAMLIVFAVVIYVVIATSLAQNAALKKFVAVNKLTPLLDETMAKLLPPSLQGIGTSRKLSDGYTMHVAGVPVYIFNYYYTELSEGRDGQHSVCIAVIQSKEPFPHIYLDGKHNKASRTYKSWQKLSLEGDFNKYFDLYAEDKMRIETLSFLAPDVMRDFIDTASFYDVEVYGNNIAVIDVHAGMYYKSNMDKLLVYLKTMLKQVTPSTVFLASSFENTAKPGALKKKSRIPKTIFGILSTVLGIILGIIFVLAS